MTSSSTAFALKLLVSNGDGAALIGPGGSAVRRLKAESGVHSVHLSNGNGDRSCSIVGPVSAIQHAFELIMALLRSEPGSPHAADLDRQVVRLLVPDGASLVGNSHIAELLQASGCESIRSAPVPMLSQRRGAPPPKEKLVTCIGTIDQTRRAVFGMLARIASRHEQRHRDFFAQWAFATDYSDHFETPREAYADIAPLLEAIAEMRHGTSRRGEMSGSSSTPVTSSSPSVSRLTVYDPYYCQGHMVSALCGAVPGLEPSHIINANRDFYADIEGGHVPLHDVLVSNPPYSGEHKQRLLHYLDSEWRGGARDGASARGGRASDVTARAKESSAPPASRPFLLLLPAWMAGTNFWQEFVEAAAGLCAGAGQRRDASQSDGAADGGGKRRRLLPPSDSGPSSASQPAAAMDTAISAEERAGIFYVSPASRYSFSHPQSTGHADSPFHAIWFCGGWASDKERRRAMRALKPLRQSGRVECFRSAAMLKRRGHFAKRSE